MTRLLKEREVLKQTGKSHSTLWREIKAGLFPQPRRSGERSIHWIESEVEEHLQNLPVANFAAKPSQKKSSGRPTKQTKEKHEPK